jgi:hypothetical protein
MDTQTPEEIEDEFIAKCNMFWEEHQYDVRLQQKLFNFYIEKQCREGNMRYKNGKNLKDGLEVVNEICRYDPVETYREMMNLY